MNEQGSNAPAGAKLARKDYLSTIDPKWCPGCGCFPILKSLTALFAAAGIPRENLAVISGIGCSSRTPYYLSAYGFHTIHGRAPAVALGLKLVQPQLSVWVVTGDGDGLSIGGNHFMHFMRRNPGIKMVLFNNQIYGLTKGQASPTTALGTKTKSTPLGAYDTPMRPLAVAVACGATFAARVPDNDPNLMSEVLQAAFAHRGAALVEVLFNCVTFNDGAYSLFTGKETRSEHSLRLHPGKPLVFGAKSERGIRFNGAALEVVEFEPGKAPADVLVHDPQREDPGLAMLLALMDEPRLFGIVRRVERPAYEERHTGAQQIENVSEFLRGDNAWEVDEAGAIRAV